MVAYIYDETFSSGVRFDTVEVPDDLKEQAAKYRESLIEAVCDFDDISFTSATISAQAAVIYNSSTVSGLTTNASVAILDFGGVKTSTAGTFTITFPAAESTAAILRIA